jgi:GAF domain-containing protein
MIAKARSWLAPPVFPEDPERTRLAGVLNPVAWIALAITLILLPALWLAQAPAIVLLLLVPLVAAEVLVLVWLRKGNVRSASLLLVFAALLTTLIPAFLQGGLDSPYLFYSLVIVTLAGLLLGPRYVNLITLLYMAAATVMLLTADSDLIPVLIAPPTPLRRWVTVIASLLMVRTLFLMAMTSLRTALEHARQNEQRLEDSNRALQNARLELELRVADRTTDLERRARQLQVSAEVVSAINSAMSSGGDAAVARDLDQLLEEITQLISDRFNFYAVNIFLVDESGEGLTMRAANTQNARQLIERGYHLTLVQPSIVASAARTRMPRLAADVRKDDQYIESAEFPYTRSEAALPLATRGRLLGVLDVQSSQAAPLTREDLSVLQTLANQVAIAIENAQLFAANQKTLQSLQRAYGDLSREAWQKLLRARPDRGYHAAALGDPSPASDEWQPEMKQARRDGQIVQADAYTLVVPVKIRDEVTGVVRLRKPVEAGEWRPEEISLVETLSDRLSAALESARLYEETRRRAERERLTGEITARMRATNDPQAILQIAARELRKALQADRTQLIVQATPSSLEPTIQPSENPPVTSSQAETKTLDAEPETSPVNPMPSSPTPEAPAGDLP